MFVLTAPVVIPIAIVLIELVSPTQEIWAHLRATLLPVMVRNTFLLIVGVAAGTLVVGTGLAWLVSIHRFPGRRFFEWALILPLALPSYIFAFVYIATFDFVGIVQTTLRGWFGEAVGFPNIYTGWSAVFVLTLTLYPYVYLIARAAFRAQSADTYDAARTMGLTRTAAFFRLMLPMARPALVAGVALASMEALGDFATVRFFNYPTLSEGVFRIWEGMMNRDAAMEVAAVLCLVALAVVVAERFLRGRARYTQTGGESPGVHEVALTGRRGWLAFGGCLAVLLAAFLLPVLQLLIWTIREIAQQGPGGTLNVAFRRYFATTSLFATLAAVAAVVWSLILAHAVRLSGRRTSQLAARLASLGYAMPGAVIGVGVLLLLTGIDAAANRWGVASGLLLTGSVFGLVYAYVVRFLAVGYNSVDAGLSAISPSLGEAARTLKAGPSRVLFRVHLPLLSKALLVGGVLVFVDVMKELPITMLLRPFGMDTFSIWAYLLAAEGFWEAAAVPSLSIVAAGLLPVIVLGRGRW